MQPCDSDPIDHITAEHESAAATLSKEARRWATKIARENNNIKESVRKLHLYNAMREAGQKVFFFIIPTNNMYVHYFCGEIDLLTTNY